MMDLGESLRAELEAWIEENKPLDDELTEFLRNRDPEQSDLEIRVTNRILGL